MLLIYKSLKSHTSYDAVLYNPYIWTLVGIWSLDRAVRIARLVVCNLKVKFGKNFIKTTTTTVQYSEESDILTITTYPTANKLLQAGPGQFYYIYQPLNFMFWQSHPFSLASYAQVPSPTGTGSDLQLTFVIRPYNGWTRQLRNKCRKSGMQITKVSMMVEGPYGHASPLHHYETVLMIVGGTGIAAGLPYISDHISRSQEGTTVTTKIHLIWSSRTSGMITEIAQTELARCMQRQDFEAEFYATAGYKPVPPETTSHTSSEEQIGTEKETSEERKQPIFNTAQTDVSTDFEPTSPSGLSAHASSNITIRSGRPSIRGAIQRASEEAQASSSRVAVFVCGPGKMADEARDSVYEIIRGGFGGIEYVEECFAW